MKPATGNLKRSLLCVLCVSAVNQLRAGEPAPVPAEQPPPAEAKKEVSAEQLLRERFLIAYQTAETPARKAEAVQMLHGLKEKESLRLLTGLLADSRAVVRISACAAMAATPDPDGYFVKPLMGMLLDPLVSVRLGAAEALANATVRGEAIKVLAYALMDLAGAARDKGPAADPALVEAYDRALQKLTGEKSAARDVRSLSSFWMDYWKKEGESILEKEKKAREVEPPPRPTGLPKDSLDK
ncbi:MAG: HEAT repeat domain-containing protein [Planctomycetota bacterium]